MAITAFKILHRSFIPGTFGYDNTGVIKQGKVRVIGEFTNSTGYTAGGEPLPRLKMGVSAIDNISFWVKGGAGGVGQPTNLLTFLTQYDDINQKFLCVNTFVTGNVIREPTSFLGVVKFEVVGDAALPTENTISDSINTGLPV